MKAAVLTVSDGVSRGRRARTAAATCSRSCCAGDGYEVERRVVPGRARRDRARRSTRARGAGARSCSRPAAPASAPRDVTPEATIARARPRGARDRGGDPRRLDREDAARAALARPWPASIGRALVVNLPGSPGGCRDGYAVLRPALEHARRAARGRGLDAPADMTASASAVELPRRFASLVKIEHTLFALPFAYVGAFLAVDGAPSAHDLLWITVAMVGARSLAMGAQPADRRAASTRATRARPTRELPAGRLSVAQVVAFCAGSLALFLVAVWQLDPIVRWLWPIPVVGFVVYPYLKRFTWLCHLWLGAVDGLAPIGAWVAITGHLPWQAWALGGAVALWVGGLRPLLRALRRRDRPRAGPALDAGRRASAMRGAFCERAPLARRDDRAARRRRPRPARSAPLLARRRDRRRRCSRTSTRSSARTTCSRLDAAFFTMNGVISVVFCACVIVDALSRRRLAAYRPRASRTICGCCARLRHARRRRSCRGSAGPAPAAR